MQVSNAHVNSHLSAPHITHQLMSLIQITDCANPDIDGALLIIDELLALDQSWNVIAQVVIRNAFRAESADFLIALISRYSARIVSSRAVAHWLPKRENTWSRESISFVRDVLSGCA